MQPIGKHFLIEAAGRYSRMPKEELRNLLLDAARQAGATVLHDSFHEFGQGCGLTGVLILAESHISVHQWPELDYAAFDVFMCGEARPDLAAKVIAEKFPDDTNIVAIDRTPPSKTNTQGVS